MSESGTGGFDGREAAVLRTLLTCLGDEMRKWRLLGIK